MFELDKLIFTTLRDFCVTFGKFFKVSPWYGLVFSALFAYYIYLVARGEEKW